MRPDLVTTPKLGAGDRVAVVSPSSGMPGVFPHVHQTSLGRLRDELGLEPVEYPTTHDRRRAGSSPRHPLLSAASRTRAEAGYRAVIGRVSAGYIHG